MRVFVTGGTGAVGMFLLPHVVENGHEVVAFVRAAQKAKAIKAMGAKVAVADALNKEKVWLGKLAIGDGGVSMMTEIRGASNAKAKRELQWQPLFASWRRGFVEGLG
jgi:uncharacterized protein YbjT (DUF2867 family)